MELRENLITEKKEEKRNNSKSCLTEKDTWCGQKTVKVSSHSGQHTDFNRSNNQVDCWP